MKRDTSVNGTVNTIIGFAQKRNDIRYVIQNGSRVNLSVTPEEFWESLFMSCELVQMIDNSLRVELQIEEKQEDGDGIIGFLKKIRNKKET